MGALPKFFDANLLVGFDTSDDACVYKIRDDLAVIQTVDFFPPVVDDPYTYGRIAAANALSDVYAMGGEPSLALNLLMIPPCLSLDAVKAIMEGGGEKVREAGGVIAGGHTIEDSEPKYGLCVSGFIHPDNVWGNSTAKAGDVLVLTKPLGSGIAIAAAKSDIITAAEFEPAVEVMLTLNKYARDAAAKTAVSACTDITGFGFLGHAKEMAEASGVTFEIFADTPELLPGVETLAKSGVIPGGAYRNREYLEKLVRFSPNVPLHIQDIFYDPQTSGGLLVSLSESCARILLSELPHTKIVGHVLPYNGIRISVV